MSRYATRYCHALCLSTAVLGFSLAAQPAAAQENGASDASLDEIIVTAQRREERLQDVPISITAISGEDAKRFAVIETKNLQFITPGLSFPEDNATINPYIRGRGTNFSGPGLEGSVAVYIDDVYLQSQFGAGGLVDVSSLQVLKGPQGTLYGRNATGGAILITTNRPTQNLEGHLEVSYGNYQMRHAEAVLNIPLSDTLAVRFAGGYDERNGYVRNVVDGSRNGAAKRYQLAGKLLWEPSSEFSALLKGEYQKIEVDYLRNQLVAGTGNATGLGFYQTHRSPSVPNAAGGENKVDVRALSLRLEYNADQFSITNVTGYRHMKKTGCSDNDNIYARDFDFCTQLPASLAISSTPASSVFTIPNPLGIDAPTTVPNAFDKTFTNETRFASSFDGMFNFMVGAAYQSSKSRFAGVLVGEAFGPLVPVFDNNIRVRNIAFYGETYIQFTEQLKLTAGGRFSKDTKKITIYNNADVATAFGIPVAFLPATVYQKKSWKSFTPRVVLSYDTGFANFYASYSAGFKSGGFNAPQSFAQIPLKPEKIDGFEIGTKLRLLDNTLWLDLAAFHTKTKNIQVASIDTSVGSVVQQNAATAKADGAEANIRFRATPDLSLQGGIAYLRSRFTDFPNAAGFDIAPSLIFGQDLILEATQNLKGFATTLSPKWTMNGAISYDVSLGSDWNAALTLSVRHSTGYDFQAGAGGPQRWAHQKAFTVANFNLDITPPGDFLNVSLYVNNMFKEKYYDQIQTNAQTGSNPLGGGVYGVPALPRTYGVRGRVSF